MRAEICVTHLQRSRIIRRSHCFSIYQFPMFLPEDPWTEIATGGESGIARGNAKERGWIDTAAAAVCDHLRSVERLEDAGECISVCRIIPSYRVA